MKIVLGYVEGDFHKQLASEFPDHEFVAAPSVGEQLEEIGDADIFYGWPGRNVFLSAQNLKWIQCGGTGVDAILTTTEIAESEVILTNMKGAHTGPIADHAFGMIITLSHRLREMWNAQAKHEWDTPRWHEKLTELENSTIGILGVGGIGTAIAKRANAFGMKVLGVDIRTIESDYTEEIWPLSKLPELAEKSDWFIVAAPYTPDSRHCVDKEVIDRMKDSANLIVVSRGGIVDEDAVLAALRSGRIAGAAFDVFEEEPLHQQSPFWDLPNVLISPHVSAETADTFSRRREMFRENLKRYFHGDSLLYQVDKHAGF